MKTRLAMLVAMVPACALAGFLKWVQPATQNDGEPPGSIDGMFPPSRELLLREGWRELWEEDLSAPVSNGWQRVRTYYAQHPTEAERALQVAEDEAMVTNRPPDFVYVMDAPIEAPYVIITSQTNGYGYAIVVEDDGDSYTVLAHQSPFDEGAFRANVASARVERASMKRALRDLKAPMTNAIAEAKLITDNKTKRAVTDTAQALNDFRKAMLRFYKTEEE